MLTVTDWDTHYENNRTRGLKRLDWIPVPNRMDGLGYSTLVDHPNGAAHLGAWLAILEICSRQDERGTFLHPPAEIPQALARISRLPAGLFEEVLPRLCEVGWIHIDGTSPQEGAVSPHDDAGERLRARAGASLPFPSLPVETTNTEKPQRAREPERGLVLAEKPTPEDVIAELESIYRQAGCPISLQHKTTALARITRIHPSKRQRLPDYCKWALATGRWPNPAKTKALVNVLESGDWDVELTMRTLPAAREPTKRETNHAVAARNFKENR